MWSKQNKQNSDSCMRVGEANTQTPATQGDTNLFLVANSCSHHLLPHHMPEIFSSWISQKSWYLFHLKVYATSRHHTHTQALFSILHILSGAPWCAVMESSSNYRDIWQGSLLCYAGVALGQAGTGRLVTHGTGHHRWVNALIHSTLPVDGENKYTQPLI